jgi:Domain of unknown function (DUF4282)
MEGSLGEYLSFRRMITPVFIQVIFWIFAGIAVLGGLAALVSGEALSGLLLIVLGPLFARIYAEILIVIFRINDNVSRIAARGEAAPAPSYAGAEPPPSGA